MFFYVNQPEINLKEKSKKAAAPSPQILKQKTVGFPTAFLTGGSDGARTRDLLRDRQTL